MGDESHDDWGNGYRQQLGDGLARSSTGNSLVNVSNTLVSVSTSLVRTVNKSDSAVSVSTSTSISVQLSAAIRRQTPNSVEVNQGGKETNYKETHSTCSVEVS